MRSESRPFCSIKWTSSRLPASAIVQRGYVSRSSRQSNSRTIAWSSITKNPGEHQAAGFGRCSYAAVASAAINGVKQQRMFALAIAVGPPPAEKPI